MKLNLKLLVIPAMAICLQGLGQPLRTPRFKVLAFFSNTVERAHIDFSDAAIKFFKELTVGNGFVFDTTSHMEDLNSLKKKILS